MSLYWTKDVKKIFDEHIGRVARELLEDKSLSDSQMATAVKHLRLCQDFANEIIAEMEEMDRKDAEDQERWKAEKAAREATEKEKPDDN